MLTATGHCSGLSSKRNWVRCHQHVSHRLLPLVRSSVGSTNTGHALKDVQRQLGSTFDAAGVPSTYGSAQQALEAVGNGVALTDRSHWGVLHLQGPGAVAFCHNQSTNNFYHLTPGQGCDTVFVTSTARCLDLAQALVDHESVLLLVSPEMKEALKDRFNKYIFPADKVTVQEVTSKSLFSLIGPKAASTLKAVLPNLPDTFLAAPYGSHTTVTLGNSSITVAVGSSLAAPGFTIMCDESEGGPLFEKLASLGCALMGSKEWEVARVAAGRPRAGKELTKDFNPMEAGLYHTLSLDKGCFIGQETLSKLSHQDGVKQQLWGLDLDGPVQTGAEVTAQQAVGAWEAGAKLGNVTSAVTTPKGGHIALALLKCRSKGQQVDLQGVKVKVGPVQGSVIPIPYATRALSHKHEDTPATSPEAEAQLKAAEEERRAKEAADKAEAEAKAARLKVMQDRLAAWQAQQAAKRQQGQGQ